MVRHKENRSVRDSHNRRVITHASIAMGRVTEILENKFIVKSSVEKRTKNLEGVLDKKSRKIVHVLEYDKKSEDYFVVPDIRYDVLLKYADKKAKFGKYDNDYDNLPLEIITRGGKLLYKKKID